MAKLEIKANKDYTLKLVYKDSDGVVIPLTGAAAVIKVRRNMYSPVVISKAATIDAPNGEMLFELVPADTAGLLTTELQEEFIYAVALTFNGKENDILEGEAIIKQSITRSE